MLPEAVQQKLQQWRQPLNRCARHGLHRCLYRGLRRFWRKLHHGVADGVGMLQRLLTRRAWRNRRARLRRLSSVRQVVCIYRKRLGENGTPLSYRKMAQQINRYTRKSGRTLSHNTLNNWARGQTTPSPTLLRDLVWKTPPRRWQGRFARELCLALDLEHLLPPWERIGRRWEGFDRWLTG